MSKKNKEKGNNKNEIVNTEKNVDDKKTSKSKVIPRREVYLDLIKIFACFFVIINHTNSKVFLEISPSPTWYASVAYFYISKVAVPLFIMSSGACLLSKVDSYKKVFKRALRIIFVLVLFSAYTYIGLNYEHPEILYDYKNFITSMMTNYITGTYWYLFLYVGLILMLPVLQRLVPTLKKIDYIYIFFISVFLLGTYPMLVHFFPALTLNGCLWLPIMNYYVGIFLMGYFIHRFVEVKPKYVISALFTYIALLVISVFLMKTEYILTDGIKYTFFESAYFITTSLAAMCFFYLIKCLFNSKFKIYNWIKNVIIFVSSYTFVIYLVADVNIKHTNDLYMTLTQTMHPLLAVLIQELIVFGIGLLIGIVIKLIPGLKKIL